MASSAGARTESATVQAITDGLANALREIIPATKKPSDVLIPH